MMDPLTVLDNYLDQRQTLLLIRKNLESVSLTSDTVPNEDRSVKSLLPQSSQRTPPPPPPSRYPIDDQQPNIPLVTIVSATSTTGSILRTNPSLISPALSYPLPPHGTDPYNPSIAYIPMLSSLVTAQKSIDTLTVMHDKLLHLYQHQLSYRTLIIDELLPLYRTIYEQYTALSSTFFHNELPRTPTSATEFIQSMPTPLRYKVALFLRNVYTRYYQSLGTLLYLFAIDMDQQLFTSGYYKSLQLSSQAIPYSSVVMSPSSTVTDRTPMLTETDKLRFTETMECLSCIQCIHETFFKRMAINYIVTNYDTTDTGINLSDTSGIILNNSLIHEKLVADIEQFNQRKQELFRKHDTVPTPLRYTITWSLIRYWLMLHGSNEPMIHHPPFPIYDTIRSLCKVLFPWRLWIMLFPIFSVYHDYMQIITDKLASSSLSSSSSSSNRETVTDEMDESNEGIGSGETTDDRKKDNDTTITESSWDTSIPFRASSGTGNRTDLSIITSSSFFLSWYKDVFDSSSYFMKWLHLHEPFIFAPLPSTLSSVLINRYGNPSLPSLALLLNPASSVTVTSLFPFLLEHATVMFMALSFSSTLTHLGSDHYASSSSASFVEADSVLSQIKYPSPLKHHYTYYLLTEKGKIVWNIQDELLRIDTYRQKQRPDHPLSIVMTTMVWNNLSYTYFPGLSVILSLHKKVFTRLFTQITENVWKLHGRTPFLHYLLQNFSSASASESVIALDECYRPMLEYVDYHRSLVTIAADTSLSSAYRTVQCSIYHEIGTVPIVTTFLDCVLYTMLQWMQDNVSHHQLYGKAKNVSRLQSLGSFRIGKLYGLKNRSSLTSASYLVNDDSLLLLMDTVYPLPSWPSSGTSIPIGTNTSVRIPTVSSYPTLPTVPLPNDPKDHRTQGKDHRSRSISRPAFGVRNLVHNVFQGITKVAAQTLERWDHGNDSDSEDSDRDGTEATVHQPTNEQTGEEGPNDSTVDHSYLLRSSTIHPTNVSTSVVPVSPIDALWSSLVPSLCQPDQGLLYDFSHAVQWLPAIDGNEGTFSSSNVTTVSTTSILECLVRMVYILDDLLKYIYIWLIRFINSPDTANINKYTQKEFIIYSTRVARIRTMLYRTVMRNITYKFMVSSLPWLGYVVQRVKQGEGLRTVPRSLSIPEQLMYSNLQDTVWQTKLWIRRFETVYGYTNGGGEPDRMVMEWYRVMDKCFVTILDDEIGLPVDGEKERYADSFAYIQKQLPYLLLHDTTKSSLSTYFPLVYDWFGQRRMTIGES